MIRAKATPSISSAATTGQTGETARGSRQPAPAVSHRSAGPRARWSPVDAFVALAYGAGALLLAGEGAVHVQQYASLFHEVRWVGPLFLGNAVASVAVIAALVYGPTRRLAALGGIVVSAVALGGLVVSYGQGLFGWQEGGFRTPIELVVIAEVGAVIALGTALTADKPR